MDWAAFQASFASWAFVVKPWLGDEIDYHVTPSAELVEHARKALEDAGWRDGDAIANLETLRAAHGVLIPASAATLPRGGMPDELVATAHGSVDHAAATLAGVYARSHGEDEGGASIQAAVEAAWREPTRGQPRLPSRTAALAMVQQHFDGKRRAKEAVAREHLVLYHTLMRGGDSGRAVVRRLDVIAFLAACASGRVDDLYIEMPTDVLSSMHGRPCRTRDHASFPPEPARLHPLVPLLVKPALLYSTPTEVVLVVRGKTVSRLHGHGGIIVPIPTSGTTEQLAVVCDATGRCVVLSTTRGGLLKVGEFVLDCPADVEDADERRITWMDAMLVGERNDVLLTWGGTDALRGLPTWSCHAGFRASALVDAEKELFYETEDGSEAWSALAARAAAWEAPLFARHGSLLTTWTRAVDDESSGVRRWARERSLLLSGTAMQVRMPAVLRADGVCVADVWGAPRQYVAVARQHASAPWRVYSVTDGSSWTEYALDEPDQVLSAAMLYAHSRW